LLGHVGGGWPLSLESAIPTATDHLSYRRARPDVRTMTIAATSTICKSRDCLGRPLELLKHW
jgi:hypothetical protein